MYDPDRTSASPPHAAPAAATSVQNDGPSAPLASARHDASGASAHTHAPGQPVSIPVGLGRLPIRRRNAAEETATISGGEPAHSGGARETGAAIQIPDAARSVIPTEGEQQGLLPDASLDHPDQDPALTVQSGESPAAGCRWARLEGQAMIPVSDLVASPFRARLPPNLDSLRSLADSLASSVQPIPPIFVRRKEGRWELLGGHRIVMAGRHYLGWTEISALVLDIPADLDAAYWVIGSDCAHERISPWVLMRAVKILLALSPGDEEQSQREIARRNKWREQAVSEAKHVGLAITGTVLERAGVDEARDAAPLTALSRDDLRDVRRGRTVAERAAILRQLVLSRRENPGSNRGRLEVGHLFHTTVDGNTWTVEVGGLAERSDAELRAISRRMVQSLRSRHRALRDAAVATPQSDEGQG